MVDKDRSGWIKHESEEMKFVFKKLFYLSINIAENYIDVKFKLKK